MTYSISPLSFEHAREITTWRYQPPYDLYDYQEESLLLLLNPEYRYHQVLDGAGDLAGFCCFGEDARVPGGEYHQFEPEILDVGLGLKPELTGNGLGKEFAQQVLAFAYREYRPDRFRVTVANFNQRSLKTFLALDFEETHQFTRELVQVRFTQLELPAQEVLDEEIG